MLVEVKARGRPAAQLEYTTVRELVPADLALLETVKGSTAPPLKRLRDRHHALARALASGMSDAEAAMTAGYDPSRVSILKADPTFQELLGFYRGTVVDAYRGMHEQLAALGSDAVDELQQRLDEEPESFDNEGLMQIVKLTADRTGHGPQSKSLNVNVNVGLAERMQLALRRARGQE